jgi:hypothetical protein
MNLKHLLSLTMLAVGLFASGCVSTSLTANKTPDADLTKLKSFYVVHLAQDERNIDKVIAQQLVAMSYVATSGPQADAPKDVDALVTYQDRWMWDLSMYMIELNVQLRNPSTQMTLATGKSFRTSLARRSPEEMAKEVLTSIFTQK